MTAIAQPPAPPDKRTPRVLIAAAVLVLMGLLVAPAAIVLALRDDGSIAVFHGPRRIARFNPDGLENQSAIRTAA